MRKTILWYMSLQTADIPQTRNNAGAPGLTREPRRSYCAVLAGTRDSWKQQYFGFILSYIFHHTTVL